MSLEHDKIKGEYAEVEAITKARDDGIITTEEYDALILVKKNEIRKLFGLEPVE